VVVLRRLPFLIVATALVVAAFTTGAPFLFFLVYLGLAVLGGSYLVTRVGLTDLEAGYAVSQLQAHVGEVLRATYTLRSASRIPKLWLEVHNPTTLPIPLPGRAISLGPHGERSWIAKVPLARRGHFRVDPLQIRTGDPFGFFGERRRGPRPHPGRLPPRRGHPALAPPGREPGGQPLDAGADAAVDPPRDVRPAVRAG